MLERTRFEQEMSELDLPGRGPARWYKGEKAPKPIRLTHFHIRKFLDPGIKALMPDPDPGVMKPARMEPRFQTGGGSLETNLKTLVETNHAASVSPPLMNLRVALVDLTGVKHHDPVYAGYHDKKAMYGASLPKVLALYAAFQLKFDLNTFAAQNKIEKADVLRREIAKQWKGEGLLAQPNVRALFNFTEKSGDPVTASFKSTPKIHGNADASRLIVMLGFEYIGSVALQSGLYDETDGGLWLNAAFASPAWTTTPFPRLDVHHATARGAATFFTLLAQGRLVDQKSSNEMAAILRPRCASNGIRDSIVGLPRSQANPPNKCGLFKAFFHEALWTQRERTGSTKLEYVPAVISRKPPLIDYRALGQQLDGLIAAAN
jgi:hypothetical protein